MGGRTTKRGGHGHVTTSLAWQARANERTCHGARDPVQAVAKRRSTAPGSEPGARRESEASLVAPAALREDYTLVCVLRLPSALRAMVRFGGFRLLRFVSGGLGRVFFFFQAEDGIRDLIVTGVQTCALPI